MPGKVFIAGEILTAADTNEFLVNNGYQLREIVYFTSSGTFAKADYPWLQAIRVKVCGAGGGGGGAGTTGAGQIAWAPSGAGGAYAESFITDIAGLSASVTVTRGSGGAGGAAGVNNGSAGGNSSFGALVTANGGNGGIGRSAVTSTSGSLLEGGASGATSATGDFTIPGANSGISRAAGLSNAIVHQPNGGSFLTPGNFDIFNGGSLGADGPAGRGIGDGGFGGANAASQGSGRAGGTGANGIVILELYG
jgi:hypothetical protein